MSKRSSYLAILEETLIPQLTGEAGQRLLVARQNLAEMASQEGVRLTPKKLIGKREAVRGYTVTAIHARWRKDHLVEASSPLLFFVLEGEADLRCSDYVMHVPQGNAVIVPEGVPRASGHEDLKKYVGNNPNRYCDNILFHERCGSLEVWFNHDRGNLHSRSGTNEILIVHNVELPRLLTAIQDELLAGRKNSRQIAGQYLAIFLYTLQRDLEERKAIYLGRLTTGKEFVQQSYNPIPHAQQYIRDHLHEHLTQESVAKRVRLSRTQFIKQFRNETGETFNQFVTRCRMEQAKIMLANTDFPVHFVALSVGYKSDVHFHQRFQKWEGMLPSVYRAAQRKNIDQ
jgi:AraC-like DNA-binding protein/mannose-6-phosphate isomerase-like protein (cupin superfamily)